MTTPLQQAAQALLTAATEEEWYEGYSGLRKALDAELAQTETVDRNLRVTEQAVEPYVACLSNCETCEYSAINPVTDGSVHCYMFRGEPIGVCASWTPIEVAPPQPQATTAVPEGYVLVPIEPTEEALANGVRAMRLFVTKNSLIDFSLGYKAMLAAAKGEKP